MLRKSHIHLAPQSTTRRIRCRNIHHLTPNQTQHWVSAFSAAFSRFQFVNFQLAISIINYDHKITGRSYYMTNRSYRRKERPKRGSRFEQAADSRGLSLGRPLAIIGEKTAVRPLSPPPSSWTLPVTSRSKCSNTTATSAWKQNATRWRRLSRHVARLERPKCRRGALRIERDYAGF